VSGLLNPLYQDVLHRAPDPDGVTNLTNLVAAGSLPDAIVGDIWGSAEHRYIEVDNY
jgi:hypothetical protein